jgi:hypothetical protein
MLCSLLQCASQTPAAENAALIQMFGGDPGSALPHAYSYGVPADTSTLYTLRIAVIDKEIRNIFYDTELSIALDGKIVRNISASRAFRTLKSCGEAREVIFSKLAVGLTKIVLSDVASWQLESEDGETRGSVFCEQIRHFPMPVLRLTIGQAP